MPRRKSWGLLRSVETTFMKNPKSGMFQVHVRAEFSRQKKYTGWFTVSGKGNNQRIEIHSRTRYPHDSSGKLRKVIMRCWRKKAGEYTIYRNNGTIEVQRLIQTPVVLETSGQYDLAV